LIAVALTGPGTRTGDSGKEWKGYNPTSVAVIFAIVDIKSVFIKN